MISTALQLYWYVLVLYVIFSWVPRPPDALRPFVVGVDASWSRSPRHCGA